ncbi:MAG TPA: hypothetical protein VHE30_16035 [Polyangiaceae bacterium]|nr:hypothetical protein [Polyangiaceae bacterium]
MSPFVHRLTLLVALAFGVAPFAFAPSSTAETTSKSSGAAPAKAGKGRSFTDDLPCSACHTTTGWRAKGASADGRKFDHASTGFPLTGQHASTPCADCHQANRTISRTCVGCHEDSHQGRLSQSCDRCHSAVSFREVRPLELHRMTRFPLTGMHALADCSECHRRASERRFTDAPAQCFACHEKDYRRPGLFPVHQGTATTAPLPRDCSLCHRAVAWVPAVGPAAVGAAAATSPLEVAPPNHDLRFPIGFGPHRGLPCPDCHVSEAAPRAVRCIGCHAHDPARVVAEHRTPVSTDGSACIGCHVGGARR